MSGKTSQPIPAETQQCLDEMRALASEKISLLQQMCEKLDVLHTEVEPRLAALEAKLGIIPRQSRLLRK